MSQHVNFLQETSTTTGTGDVTLVAKTGFPRFLDALTANDTVEYSIDNGNQWETGLGTIVAGNILERTTVYATYDGTTYDNSSPTAITLAGSSTVYGTNTAENIDDPIVNSLIVNDDGNVTLGGTGRLILPQTNVGATPTISFGDGDTGIYESGDDTLRMAFLGSGHIVFNTTGVYGSGGAGFRVAAIATKTLPTIFADIGDADTGIGKAGPDQLSLIAGAIEGIRLTEVSSHVIRTDQINTGITASTTQTQGNGVLLSSYNEVSVVANANDTVTLPAATAGKVCEIRNNGANVLQIFPASGDNLGAGVDTAELLQENNTITFRGLDTTNWYVSSEIETPHADIYDQDNTDAFIINDAGSDFHVYHTNGLVSNDLLGFTFDAGGAGTSFPIASIADAGGGDITVTTTGNHGLAIGDVISQTNLADAAYVGIFPVLTVPSATTYTVTATYTATGTGTMDQAATLEVDALAAGRYSLIYNVSATTSTNNETFDFELWFSDGVTASVINGSKVRRKFGTSNDFGASSGGGIHNLAGGTKIALALSNNDSGANITIRNYTLIMMRL